MKYFLILNLILLAGKEQNAQQQQQLQSQQGYQPQYNPAYGIQSPTQSTQRSINNQQIDQQQQPGQGGINSIQNPYFNEQNFNQNQNDNTLEQNPQNIPKPGVGYSGGGGTGSGSFYDSGGFGTQYNRNRYQTNFADSNSYAYDGYDDGNNRNFCPEYWTAHDYTCYRFIKSPRRSWYDAKKICKAYNSDLVHMDRIDRHSFILRELILDNQKNNRYWISARMVSPKNWMNDDGTSFLSNLEQYFSYEELPIENEDLHDNRFLMPNRDYNYLTDNYGNNRGNDLYSSSGAGGGGGGAGNLNNYNNQNPNLNTSPRNPYWNVPGRGYGGGLNDQRQFVQKDRLVYAFSRQNDRWMLIPSYDFETNLFICQSRELYNIENLNLLADERRPFDYGIEVKDFEKIPRGPYFVKQPRDTTFDTSKTRLINDVTLSCLAGGFPTATYRWFKEEYHDDLLNFLPIDPIVNSRYTVSGGNLIIYDPKQTPDQGSYHCVAENKFGRIRSESVQLNFGFINEFNLKRSAESSDMNWGKVLFCDPPQHYPNVKYYWTRNFPFNFVEEDQRVFVSNDGALYFSSTEAVDRANYSCSVQSLVSDTGRNGPMFPLRVKAKSDYQSLIFANSFPKVFPEAPIAGEEIRLECVAFGYPVPAYNWTRRGGALPRHSYQESFNRVLIVPNATINDNGEYVCTINNQRLSREKSIILNIQMKPNFTIPLRDKIKDYNSDVSFICEAAAIPDVNYTWYKNAEQLFIDKLNRDKYIIQDNVLTIKYLEPDNDDGMYQCKAENQLKGVFTSAQLRVLSMKPSFKKRPLESEIYAIYNGNTTIVCDPEAAPRPKFQWKKDGNVIGSGGHRRISPTGTLTIAPTSRDDEGIYTCVATNANGTDESNARLIVLQELRFTQQPPARIITQIHQFIYLTCEVTYDEVLDVAFMWAHNGQILKDENVFQSRIQIDRNTLAIHNLTTLDSGEYECIVQSSVNNISAKSEIVVEGPPGAAGGVTVVEIGKTRALIEWVDGTNNGRPILFYNILGRTNWNKTWVNVSTQVQAHEVDRYTGRQRAEITGLTPWSGYEFSVCAVNDLGIGQPSAPSPVYNTLEDLPYIAPRNVGGGGGKVNDLTIKWDPLLPQEQNSLGIHYKVFYRLKGQQEWATDIRKTQGNAGIAVISLPMNKNLYYTEFEVKAQAINNVGKGPESNISSIYSAEDMPQVAPQQVIARSFNSTALNVTWNPIEMTREKIRGKLIGHRLKYWKKDIMAEEDATYYLSRTTRNWALIVGLEPDTYYFVKIMAYNAAGEGPESERYIERTYRKAPQKPPSSVFVYGINPSTVRVVWRYISPSQEEEPIQGYKVRVWESDQDMVRANDTIIRIGNKLEAYVDDLTPGKSYNLRVLAFSNGGDGRMSSPTIRFQMGKTTRNSAQNKKLNDTIFLGIIAIIFLHTMVLF